MLPAGAPVTFDWMTPTHRPDRTATRRRLALEECAQRAALLQRLGYPRDHILRRLQANLAWDFAIGASAPIASSDLEALLDALGL